MTCIAALSDEGRVYMAGDSVGDYAGTVIHMAERKVVALGEYLMGFSGSGRVGSLVRSAFVPPPPPTGCDLAAFMATEFCDALHSLVSSRRALETDEETKRESLGGALLVGVRGRIFFIDAMLASTEVLTPYFAVGSGSEVALGVLYACTRAVVAWDIPADEISPEGVVEMAVEAAIHLTGSCGGRVDGVCVGAGLPAQ